MRGDTPNHGLGPPFRRKGREDTRRRDHAVGQNPAELAGQVIVDRRTILVALRLDVHADIRYRFQASIHERAHRTPYQV